MKLPFQIDLKDKVVVVTGAGGVLCSMFAAAVAETGAKVALLDLNEEAAKANAEAIVKDGGIAKGYACNVLQRESIEAARDAILADFGTCDILINGAGGNNPREMCIRDSSADCATSIRRPIKGFRKVSLSLQITKKW